MKAKLLLATAAVALLPIAALAQGGSDDSNTSPTGTVNTETEQHNVSSRVSSLNDTAEQKKEAAEQKVADKKAEICAKRHSRLDARENVVSKHEASLMIHYKKVADRLQAEIDRAVKDGVTGDNLTKLQSDLATYKEKMAKLQTDLDKLQADITNVKANLHCDNTDKNSSSAARTQVRDDKKAVIADRLDLHKFYAQTIVPDRNKLRQDILKAEGKTTDTKTETDSPTKTTTQ